MDLEQKLHILSMSAKYDVACTSSGSNRKHDYQALGSTMVAGCCHSFSADGRCISLLKVLLSNNCIYNCRYCENRQDNDIARATFLASELAELTIEFYRRNYIEGLFLSSAIVKNADYTMEQMIKTLSILRYKHNFGGYIHAKTIPGSSADLVQKLGLLADRLSVNIELPSEQSLQKLAPLKTKANILRPMAQIATNLQQNKQELALYRKAPRFATAGQSTQMIIGASPENDLQIMRLSAGLYQKYGLKRVFYSAYIPVVEDKNLPALQSAPPLLREHRLYQADFLLRQYKFNYQEILSEANPNFNPYLDPKCNWALHNPHFFPIDINTADLKLLLRIPGIGPLSARRIIVARKNGKLDLNALKRIGVVLKRAQFFIICADLPQGMKINKTIAMRSLIDKQSTAYGLEQMTLFGNYEQSLPQAQDIKQLSTTKQALKEAISCLSAIP